MQDFDIMESKTRNFFRFLAGLLAGVLIALASVFFLGLMSIN